MTAAAAGSVGLVLTAILLLNGVLAFPGGKPAETEISEIAELGEPEETPADHFVASTVPPAVANAVRDDREPVGVAADRRLNETSGDIIWNDDEPVVPALKSLAASGGNTISQFDRAPADDDPFDANDPPAQSAPADRAEPLLVANEAPAFADGASQPVELPDLADESLKLEEEEPASKEPFTREITEPANESDADMPPGSFSNDEPPTSDKDQRLEEFDTPTSHPEPRDRADVVLESDAEDETLPTVPRKPAAGMTGQPPKPPRAREILPEDDGQFIQPQTEPGWKYSTTDPPPARKEPAPEAVVKPAPGTSPGPAAQSRAVETAVYATPNAPGQCSKNRREHPGQRIRRPGPAQSGDSIAKNDFARGTGRTGVRDHEPQRLSGEGSEPVGCASTGSRASPGSRPGTVDQTAGGLPAFSDAADGQGHRCGRCVSPRRTFPRRKTHHDDNGDAAGGSAGRFTPARSVRLQPDAPALVNGRVAAIHR
jgi:hypothetical protein